MRYFVLRVRVTFGEHDTYFQVLSKGKDEYVAEAKPIKKFFLGNAVHLGYDVYSNGSDARVESDGITEVTVAEYRIMKKYIQEL
jgi:hypothetical protein